MENDATQEAQPEKTIMLQIVIDKDGNLGVSGIACADKTAAFGLLESAKDIIRDMHKPVLVKPNGFRLTRGH